MYPEKQPSIKDLANIYFNEYGVVILPSVEEIKHREAKPNDAR